MKREPEVKVPVIKLARRHSDHSSAACVVGQCDGRTAFLGAWFCLWSERGDVIGGELSLQNILHRRSIKAFAEILRIRGPAGAFHLCLKGQALGHNRNLSFQPLQHSPPLRSAASPQPSFRFRGPVPLFLLLQLWPSLVQSGVFLGRSM